MSERDFVYWLRGMLEGLGQKDELKPWQVKLIKEHLEKLFAGNTKPITLPDGSEIDSEKLLC